MTTINTAFYARVSSDKQVQANTIESQVVALEKRIEDDGRSLLHDNKFIDNGYSGATLIRPALEQLRDKVAQGCIECLYVHSPDRLSRKYAYQMILLEEFKQYGLEVIFLNYDMNDNPESQLLLQMQGMISEYERAKIMERHRRGKIHSAKRGSHNVLGTAPYGYHYTDKYTGGGEASLEINEDQAATIRKMFMWIGQERLSIGEVSRRLDKEGILTAKGKKHWDRSTIWGMLKNPAYKGEAAFGKTKTGKVLPRIRPQKHSQEQPRKNYSVYPVEKKDWIMIPVPPIISTALFETVQEQLEENRKMTRTCKRGARYLLQGLLVCARCQYSFYGKPVRNKRGEKIIHYAYYRCIGTDAYRFGGNKICTNKQIRTDTLEMAVWDEVLRLLKSPNHIREAYEHQLDKLGKTPEDNKRQELEHQGKKIQQGLNRLIDSYTEGYLTKAEFEPRIKALKNRLKTIEEQCTIITDHQTLKSDLQLIVSSFEVFSKKVSVSLDEVDWETKRTIIRTLVKRVEINLKEVNVVFKINPELIEPDSLKNSPLKSLQDCCRGNYCTLRRPHRCS